MSPEILAQDLKWALYEDIELANGTTMQEPVGECCEQCFLIKKSFPQYDEIEELAEAADKEAEAADQVQEARDNLQANAVPEPSKCEEGIHGEMVFSCACLV